MSTVASGGRGACCGRDWGALVRLADALDPSYRD
jgi:hypothetical protein